MDTITIKQEKYEIIKFVKSGVLTEVPGILAGAKILTNGFGGNLKIFDARSRNGIEPLLVVECKEGRQENENILIEPRKYEGGIAVQLEGINAEARLYHKPFDMVQDLHKILEIKEKEQEPQWVQEYRFSLTAAATNQLVDPFPTRAKYLFVKKLDGSATVKFNSANEESFTLTENGVFKYPFDQLYLTWEAQTGVELIFYVSNEEINTDCPGKVRGDAVGTMESVANNAYLTVRPAVGEEWIIETILLGGVGDVEYYDGTTSIDITTAEAAGALENRGDTLTRDLYLRIQNTSGGLANFGYIGYKLRN